MNDLFNLTRDQEGFLNDVLKNAFPMILIVNENDDENILIKNLKKHVLLQVENVEFISIKEDLNSYIQAVKLGKNVVGFSCEKSINDLLNKFENEGYDLKKVQNEKLISIVGEALLLNKNASTRFKKWDKIAENKENEIYLSEISENLRKIDLSDWDKKLPIGSRNKSSSPIFCIELFSLVDKADVLTRFGIDAVIRIGRSLSDHNLLSHELFAKSIKEQAYYYLLHGKVNLPEVLLKLK